MARVFMCMYLTFFAEEVCHHINVPLFPVIPTRISVATLVSFIARTINILTNIRQLVHGQRLTLMVANSHFR